MNCKFYLVENNRLFCVINNQTFELINNEWSNSSNNEIMDRILGYDSSEPSDSPYAIGNTDIMSSIKELTLEETIEKYGEKTIRKIKKVSKEAVLKYKADSYVVRDTFKSKDYYLKQLEMINERVNRFKEKFNNGEVKGLENYYIMLSRLTFQKISILYVISAEYDAIKQYIYEYFKIINEKTKYSQLTYTEIINLLSLGYLFQIDISEYGFIRQNMVDEKYIDAILDLLRNKIFENKVSTTKNFYFKEKGYFGDEYDKDSNGLMNVINSDSIEGKNQEFVDFLNNVKTKYYNRLLKEYERIGENRYTYIGSFDFKLTAIAKILDIDKGLLKDSKFIAVDLI